MKYVLAVLTFANVVILAVILSLAGSGALNGNQGAIGPAGPAGPAGPPGSAGESAAAAHLGVCVSEDSYYPGDGQPTWLTDVSVYAPIVNGGVPSCPTGTFVSVVPSTSSTASP